MKIYYTAIELPTGLALAAATKDGITRLVLNAGHVADFVDELRAEFGAAPSESERPFKQLKKELSDYFRGEPVSFSVGLDINGTEFQRRVWKELLRISYGNVRSYKWLAGKAGSPNAARAVGNALNGNRVAIVIPCHRIVNSSGALGGFGCGLDVKRRLLEIEGVLPRLRSQ